MRLPFPSLFSQTSFSVAALFVLSSTFLPFGLAPCDRLDSGRGEESGDVPLSERVLLLLLLLIGLPSSLFLCFIQTELNSQLDRGRSVSPCTSHARARQRLRAPTYTKQGAW